MIFAALWCVQLFHLIIITLSILYHLGVLLIGSCEWGKGYLLKRRMNRLFKISKTELGQVCEGSLLNLLVLRMLADQLKSPAACTYLFTVLWRRVKEIKREMEKKKADIESLKSCGNIFRKKTHFNTFPKRLSIVWKRALVKLMGMFVKKSSLLPR